MKASFYSDYLKWYILSSKKDKYQQFKRKHCLSMTKKFVFWTNTIYISYNKIYSILISLTQIFKK